MQIDNFVQSDDVRGATNVSPLVNDAMLAETLKLKPNSSSAGNLATKLVKIIFKTDEIEIALAQVEKINWIRKNLTN